MRIDGPRPPAASGGPKKAEAAAGGFSAAPSAPASRAAAAAPAQALTSLDGLMALQGEAGFGGERRRRQLVRAETALDALDAVRLALLGGGDPTRLRAALKAATEGRELTGEPGLDGLLEDIDVRAAVELAKLERDGRTAV